MQRPICLRAVTHDDVSVGNLATHARASGILRSGCTYARAPAAAIASGNAPRWICRARARCAIKRQNCGGITGLVQSELSARVLTARRAVFDAGSLGLSRATVHIHTVARM